MAEQVKKSILKRWWFWVLVVAVLAVIGFAMGEKDEAPDANNQSTTPAKTWQTVMEYSGTEKEGFSDVFELTGGKVRITYDIATTTKEETVDSGTALIYLLKEGTTKAKNADGELDVAVQDVSAVGTKKNETKIVEKEAGRYFIDVNTSSVASYTIKVEEEK